MARKLSNVGFPFIKIQLGQFSLVRSLYGGKGSRPDFFTSLSHKRYVDKANTCDISLSYSPPKDNPNTLEAAVVSSGGVIKFQYGLEGYKSLTYEGLIYDYNVNFSEGYLNYGFKVISRSATTSSDTVISYRFDKGDDVESQMTSAEFLSQLEYWIHQNGFFNSYNGEMYKFSTTLCDKDFHIPAGGIYGSNVTPIKALQDMATKFISNDGSDVKYRLVIDDSVDGPNAGCIYFKRDGEVVADFNFDWNSKNSDVISWSPSFQGAAAIFFARGSSDSEYSPIKQAISIGSDESGYGTYEKVDVSGLNQENSVRFFTDQRTVLGSITSDLNWFYNASKYAYRANIVVLGRPEVELVKTYVNVRPHINGQLHHTAGTYMIIGITDKVDSSGFTTSLDLVKMDNLQEIYKMGASLRNLLESNETKPIVKPRGRRPNERFIFIDMEE